jgi:hypothetical protein
VTRSFEHRTTLTVEEFTVTILERTEIRIADHGQGLTVLARKEPFAVVVEANEGDGKLVWP